MALRKLAEVRVMNTRLQNLYQSRVKNPCVSYSLQHLADTGFPVGEGANFPGDTNI